MEDTSPEEEVGVMYPDVEILKKQPEQTRRPTSPEGGITVLTPATMIIPRPVIEVNIPVVEIRDRENQQLITAIEILSPANRLAVVGGGGERKQAGILKAWAWSKRQELRGQLRTLKTWLYWPLILSDKQPNKV